MPCFAAAGFIRSSIHVAFFAMVFVVSHAIEDAKSCHPSQTLEVNATAFVQTKLRPGFAAALGDRTPTVSDDRKEAVVLVTRSLNACTFKRFLALALSCERDGDGSVKRDVWLLYDASHQNSISLGLLTAAKEEGLYIDAQPQVPTEGHFQALQRESRSGLSMASFLLWASRRSAQYKHFWHVEDDVFMTGSWAPLFDELGLMHHDVIAETRDQAIHPRAPCLVEVGRGCDGVGWDEGSPHPQTAFWALLRISARLATALVEAVALPNGARGHVESVTMPFCRYVRWCSWMDLPKERVGRFVLGGGPIASCGSEHRSKPGLPCTPQGLAGDSEVQPGRIYHPAKCDTEKLGSPQLGGDAMRWAKVAHSMFSWAQARVQEVIASQRGGTETLMEVASMIDDGQQLFGALLATATNYFEFGSGDSTVRAIGSPTIQRIHTVEHDLARIKKLRERIDVSLAEDQERFNFVAIDLGPVQRWTHPELQGFPWKARWKDYSAQILAEATTQWDLISVHGPFRLSCVLNALRHIKDPSVARVIIHDYERDQYHPVEAFATIVEQQGNLAVFRKRSVVDNSELERAVQDSEKTLALRP